MSAASASAAGSRPPNSWYPVLALGSRLWPAAAVMPDPGSCVSPALSAVPVSCLPASVGSSRRGSASLGQAANRSRRVPTSASLIPRRVNASSGVLSSRRAASAKVFGFQSRVEPFGEADELLRGVVFQRRGGVEVVVLVGPAGQRAHLAADRVLQVQDRAELHDDRAAAALKVGHLQGHLFAAGPSDLPCGEALAHAVED